MPTGFNVETGSDLSPRLKEIAPRLSNFLKARREAGATTPRDPMTANALVGVIGEAGFHVSDADIRAMVNYLRRSFHPIGSAAGGYFWAVKRHELDHTIQHLDERIGAIRAARDGLDRSLFEGQGTLFSTEAT